MAGLLISIVINTVFGSTSRGSGPLGTEEDSKTEAKASEYEPSPENSLKHRMILVGKENIAYLYSKGVEREHCIVA